MSISIQYDKLNQARAERNADLEAIEANYDLFHAELTTVEDRATLFLGYCDAKASVMDRYMAVYRAFSAGLLG